MTEAEINILFKKAGYEKTKISFNGCTYSKMDEDTGSTTEIIFCSSVGGYPILYADYAHYFIEQRNARGRLISTYIDAQTHEAITQKMLLLKEEFDTWAKQAENALRKKSDMAK